MKPEFNLDARFESCVKIFILGLCMALVWKKVKHALFTPLISKETLHWCICWILHEHDFGPGNFGSGLSNILMLCETTLEPRKYLLSNI